MRRVGLVLLSLAYCARALAADGLVEAICTDRPTKSTGTCTAEPGHLQLETELANYTESTTDGVRTRTWVGLNPTAKVGLRPGLDVEANLPVWTDTTVSDAAGGTASARGMGDLSARLKWKFHADPLLELALLASVKAPSGARAISNGQWEGALLLPIVVNLSPEWVLNLSPEIDAAANTATHGQHVATAQLINLSRSLPHDLTLSAEVWAAWDADPAGHRRQRSFDVGLAWLITRALQLDTGANLGLDRDTPALQAYLGLSQRF